MLFSIFVFVVSDGFELLLRGFGGVKGLVASREKLYKQGS